MRNEQGITNIEMVGKIRCHCPISNAWYSGNVTIAIDRPEDIPDYCELDKSIKLIDGTTTTIEEAIQNIFYMASQEVPGRDHLVVAIEVNDAAHFPVTVTKAE